MTEGSPGSKKQIKQRRRFISAESWNSRVYESAAHSLQPPMTWPDSAISISPLPEGAGLRDVWKMNLSHGAVPPLSS
jgi:hypothetical protein